MAILFDGAGSVTIPTWEAALSENYTLYVDFTGVPGAENVLLGHSTTRGLSVTSQGVQLRYYTTGSNIYEFATASDLRDGERHTIEIVVTPGDASMYVDGSPTASDSFVYPSSPGDYRVSNIGKRGTILALNGMIIHQVTLTDGDIGTNNSDYLFTETSGTTTADTGDRAAAGTLVDFVGDPWTGAASPQVISPANIEPGQTVTVQLNNFSVYPTEITLTGAGVTPLVLSLTQVSGDEHTFTMPSLPALGGSAPMLKAGTVTLTVTGES